ncbi:GNAT family N-acetyltransferase [Bacillus thuringiensis]|uniref:GNAT family N-acetyltransferase n=1 Tax=Bacillus thuringiensis TaxID=1428 RepID=A0AAW9GQU8_BACTU|nr:GNAT family N-acetyltransferase [Bacillus thuringiensis]MDY0853966.1 GNAT family N-acetyltransferase [Bacillus thuringiensis]MDY4393929.1 GNAT family N-acetyltransferase [Bacillus thuringiensis]
MIHGMDVQVRECTEADSEKLAQFYNKYQYGPIKHGYPLNKQDIKQLFRERKIQLYLIAEYENEIIASLLFSSLSGQRAATPDGTWAGFFLIHPEFRSGNIPDKLFAYAIKNLIQQDIKYIDTEVNPEDKVAMALYKRVGLYQTSRSYIDYDGYLNLRSYLPYVINYLLDAFKPIISKSDQDIWLSRGWKTVRGLKSLRSIQSNAITRNGIEVVKYAINLGAKDVNCWVDIKSEKITEVETEQVRFTSYILEGNNLIVGEKIRICYVYEHHFPNPIETSITSTIGDDYLIDFKKTFYPNKKYEWEEVITVNKKIEGELVTKLKAKELELIVHFGVTIANPLEVNVANYPKLINGKESACIVNVKNNTLDRLIYKLLIQQGNSKILDFKPLVKHQICVLEPGEIKQHPILLSPKKIGITNMTFSAVSHQNKSIGDLKTIIPIHAHGKNHVYETEEHLVLENMYITVQISKSTGCLYIYDLRKQQLLVKEAWPDLDYPFLNAVKEPKVNELSWAIKSDSCFEIIHKATRLKRSIRFLSDKIVQIKDFAQEGKYIKIYPWCMLYDAKMTVPLKSGLVSKPMVYGEYPYALHDYEFVNQFDLPSHPDMYERNYTLFESQNINIGFIWKGNIERILFGLRWMPAVIFTRNDKEKCITKTHYYTLCSRDSKDEVEEIYNDITSHTSKFITNKIPYSIETDQFHIINENGEFYIYGSLKNLFSSILKGKLTLVFPQIPYEQHLFIQDIDSISNFDFEFNGKVKWSKAHYATLTYQDDLNGNTITKNIYLFPKGRNELTYNEKKQEYLVQNNVLDIMIKVNQSSKISEFMYKDKEILKGKSASNSYNFLPGLMIPTVQSCTSDCREDLSINSIHLKNSANSVVVKENTYREFIHQIFCQSNESKVGYTTVFDLPILQVQMKNLQKEKMKASVFHLFWEKKGKTKIKKIYYWQNGEQNTLIPNDKQRKIYLDKKVILELSNGLYVSILALSNNTKCFIYEWPKKGIQIGIYDNQNEFYDADIRFNIAVGETLLDSEYFSQILLEGNMT